MSEAGAQHGAPDPVAAAGSPSAGRPARADCRRTRIRRSPTLRGRADAEPSRRLARAGRDASRPRARRHPGVPRTQPARRLRPARPGRGRHRRGLPPGCRHPARRGRGARGGRAPQPRGATAVVTLEPCNHTGRTGPCAEALIDGRGRPRRLRPGRPQPGGRRGRRRACAAAGVDVEPAACSRTRPRRSTRRGPSPSAHGRPLVTWKVASTLDGRVAAADGSSRWITGAEARAEVHELRAEVDAVLVGTGTVAGRRPAR